jgi:hypothetical protein
MSRNWWNVIGDTLFDCSFNHNNFSNRRGQKRGATLDGAFAKASRWHSAVRPRMEDLGEQGFPISPSSEPGDHDGDGSGLGPQGFDADDGGSDDGIDPDGVLVAAPPPSGWAACLFRPNSPQASVHKKRMPHAHGFRK